MLRCVGNAVRSTECLSSARVKHPQYIFIPHQCCFSLMFGRVV